MLWMQLRPSVNPRRDIFRTAAPAKPVTLLTRREWPEPFGRILAHKTGQQEQAARFCHPPQVPGNRVVYPGADILPGTSLTGTPQPTQRRRRTEETRGGFKLAAA
jgi:hypothetical protein